METDRMQHQNTQLTMQSSSFSLEQAAVWRPMSQDAPKLPRSDDESLATFSKAMDMYRCTPENQTLCGNQKLHSPSPTPSTPPMVRQCRVCTYVRVYEQTYMRISRATMRAELIGHIEPCMTEIYLHIDARMADYIRTHP